MAKRHAASKSSTTRAGALRPKMRRGLIIAAVGLAGVLAAGVGLILAGDKSPFKGVPDLFGRGQRTLPAGALHVDDLAADMKGFQGTIVVRGVMAVATPNPELFAVIDSREARVCPDLQCAKFYLPVKTTGPVPKPWDELNIRGKILNGPRFAYIEAETVENLGSIKK